MKKKKKKHRSHYEKRKTTVKKHKPYIYDSCIPMDFIRRTAPLFGTLEISANKSSRNMLLKMASE